MIKDINIKIFIFVLFISAVYVALSMSEAFFDFHQAGTLFVGGFCYDVAPVLTKITIVLHLKACGIYVMVLHVAVPVPFELVKLQFLLFGSGWIK